MNKEQSRFNFMGDMINRSQNNSSMIYSVYPEFGYEFTIDQHNISVYNKLHDVILNNLYETVSFVHAKKKCDIENIFYHKKYGWTLVAKAGKAFLGKLQKTKESKIEIGLMSYISGSSNIFGEGVVKIGSFSSIANGIEVLSSNYSHPTHLLSTYNFTGNCRILEERAQFDTPFQDQPDNPWVSIGSDVWIGKDVLIMNGVNIGNGAVVAARSIVNKDIEGYSVCAGIPAKIVRYRFDKKERDQNNKLEWWSWSLDKIKDNKELFC